MRIDIHNHLMSAAFLPVAGWEEHGGLRTVHRFSPYTTARPSSLTTFQAPTLNGRRSRAVTPSACCSYVRRSRSRRANDHVSWKGKP